MEQKLVKHRPQAPLSDERKQAYLDCLRATGSTTQASASASPHTKAGAYNSFRDEIRRCPEFARQVEEAKAEYKEVILAAIHERAIVGTLVPQFSGKTGKQMVDSEGKPAFVRTYSDEALRLSVRRRSLWGDEFAQSSKVDTTVTTHPDNVFPRLDLTRAEVFSLPESDRKALAIILRKVAAMRNEASPEEAERQAVELIEHNTSEAEFEEVELEPWELAQ